MIKLRIDQVVPVNRLPRPFAIKRYYAAATVLWCLDEHIKDPLNNHKKDFLSMAQEAYMELVHDPDGKALRLLLGAYKDANDVQARLYRAVSRWKQEEVLKRDGALERMEQGDDSDFDAVESEIMRPFWTLLRDTMKQHMYRGRVSEN